MTEKLQLQSVAEILSAGEADVEVDGPAAGTTITFTVGMVQSTDLVRCGEIPIAEVNTPAQADPDTEKEKPAARTTADAIVETMDYAEVLVCLGVRRLQGGGAVKFMRGVMAHPDAAKNEMHVNAIPSRSILKLATKIDELSGFNVLSQRKEDSSSRTTGDEIFRPQVVEHSYEEAAGDMEETPQQA